MLTATLLALLTAATTAPIPPAEAVVTEVVDGDTIEVVVNGVTERVRLIGIDAPEVGQCGYEEATDLLDLLIGDDPVTLSGGDAVDRYGRLLRFVSVAQPIGEVYGADTYDAGVALIANGYAIARYDSSDGYGAHSAEVLYHDTDVDSPDPVLNACDPGQELPARFVWSHPDPRRQRQPL
jgi:micrococcal nuclease